MRALLDNWLAWETQALKGGCVFVAASVEFDDQPGPMRDALVRNQTDWNEFVMSVAGTAVDEGDFRADLDLQQFAFTLQGLMYAYHHATRMLGDPHALERTKTGVERLIASSSAE